MDNAAAGPTRLDPATVEPEPLALFRRWLAEAEQAGLPLPNAMGLATADASGRPSVRLVLLKEADERGFVFFTNYRSRKGRELEINPRAELVFYWSHLDRQVRAAGSVEKVSAAESDAYFATRPRGSQLSAWASPQSEPVPSRNLLEERMRELAGRYPREVPRPEHWGGYLLRPERVEFWHNRSDRLHDRVCYTRGPEGSWTIERLAP